MPAHHHRSLLSYRQCRRCHGRTNVSQREVVRKFKFITQPEWCRIENHDRVPRPKLAKLLSIKTGVPLETLLGLR